MPANLPETLPIAESARPGPPHLPAELLAVLAELRDPAQVALLLDDLLTPQEIEALTERWHIAERLSRGESQRAVAEALAVSVTTVSRGARSLKYGGGGFALALQTLKRLATRGGAA